MSFMISKVKTNKPKITVKKALNMRNRRHVVAFFGIIFVIDFAE
jgi:hypothetical protein